jgi:hypothetical protein
MLVSTAKHSNKLKNSDRFIVNHHENEEKDRNMMEQNDYGSDSLVVIARNGSGQIATRIISRYGLTGALRTAWSLLKLKAEAVGVEVHADEGPTSTYSGKPLAAMSVDDLVLPRHQVP